MVQNNKFIDKKTKVKKTVHDSWLHAKSFECLGLYFFCSNIINKKKGITKRQETKSTNEESLDKGSKVSELFNHTGSHKFHIK